MHGLKELLYLRKQGVKPAHVWIHALEKPATRNEIDKEVECLSSGFHFTMLLDPDVNPFRLDLIALQGIVVHVVGNDKQRCVDVFNACKTIAARVFTANKDWFFDSKGTA